LAVISVLVLVGCAPQVTIVTEEGGEEVTITAEAGAEGWCEAGANWEMTATGAEGGTEATWVIEGLVTSGEYAGLCHVIYTVTDPSGEVMHMDYWFDESGESGYFEMDVGGQKFKQEWHG